MGFFCFKRKKILRATSVSHQRNIPIGLKSDCSLPLYAYQKELEALQGKKTLIHYCLPTSLCLKGGDYEFSFVFPNCVSWDHIQILQN